jgi:hypothetical protein
MRPESGVLVPTVPRGNAILDAPRRLLGAESGTQSVPCRIPTQSVGTSLLFSNRCVPEAPYGVWFCGSGPPFTPVVFTAKMPAKS